MEPRGEGVNLPKVQLPLPREDFRNYSLASDFLELGLTDPVLFHEVFQHLPSPDIREAEELVRRMSCPSCDVRILDMKDQAVASRARELGIRSVPAVAVDGKLADCCAGRGPDEATLRAAGIGNPMS